MPSIAADLKQLRQQVEKLQVEVAGRKAIGAMVVWDEQNQSYVNQIGDDFSGLVIHLTPEPSPLEGTVESDSEEPRQTGLNQLQTEILNGLLQQAAQADFNRD